jgi:Lrp/AsnC family transcriptional regulator, leucine-responsive regulatory protein
MEKLTLKDKKLLYYLSKNARESRTKIAKSVGLSKNAVSYKIERLTKMGIIKNFSTVINMGALNYDTFALLLKFNDDIYKNKEIINYLKEYAYVNWIITLSGDWDIFAEFIYKDMNHFFQILNELFEQFGESLNLHKILYSNQSIKVEHLVPDFYKDIELPEIEKHTRKYSDYKLDKVDKQILSLLALDSSLNFVELAEKLKLTLDVVRYRIKNMIKSGIIISFFPEVSLDKLGYTEYLCTLQLKNSKKGNIDHLKNLIKNNKNVSYAFFDPATLNLVFVCAFANSNGIDTLLRGLRSNFSEMINNQTYLIIKEQVLFNLFPRGLNL